MSELFRNVGRMTLTGEHRSTWAKNASQCDFVHHKSHMDWQVLLGPSLGVMVPTSFVYYVIPLSVSVRQYHQQAGVYCLLNAFLLHAGVTKIHMLNLWLRQIKLKVTGNEQNQMLQNICDFSGMSFYRAWYVCTVILGTSASLTFKRCFFIFSLHFVVSEDVCDHLVYFALSSRYANTYVWK